MVYVELEPGFTAQQVYDELKADAYFASDELHVIPVDSVDNCKDMGHGVLLERKGVSGMTQNQRFEFKMSINNPALTGQILVSCARAVVKQKAGCYVMPEIAPMDYLPGSKESLIRALVLIPIFIHKEKEAFSGLLLFLFMSVQIGLQKKK